MSRGADDAAAQLVRPDARHRHGYEAMVREVAARGEVFVPFTLGYPLADFDALLARLAAEARGEGLAAGWVAHSSFWLLDARGDVVGVSDLRHALVPQLERRGGHIGYGIRPSARGRGYGTIILRLTLERAAALGLRRVLLTCDRTNVASARVIANNGGVLASEEFVPEDDAVVQRWWITLPG